MILAQSEETAAPWSPSLNPIPRHDHFPFLELTGDLRTLCTSRVPLSELSGELDIPPAGV